MKEISVSELKLNPFDEIGREWFLVTAGDESGFNTMTAGWGFMGVMWGKNVFEAVVRPCRYTYEFMEKNDLFTVSFFDGDYRKALQFCGSHSGRDCDKAKETGLTPVFTDGTVAFGEARLVYVCRKIYAADFLADSINPEDNARWNGGEPVHRQYIGEILKVYKK